MAVTIAFKRLFLRELKWSAEALATTLYEALKSASRAKIKVTTQGTRLIGTSASGVSASFTSNIPPGDATEGDITDLCSELLDSYDRIKAALIAAGTASPSDAQILAAMLADDSMESVTESFPDFSGMRA